MVMRAKVELSPGLRFRFEPGIGVSSAAWGDFCRQYQGLECTFIAQDGPSLMVRFEDGTTRSVHPDHLIALLPAGTEVRVEDQTEGC
jgi:hypothetical protein